MQEWSASMPDPITSFVRESNAIEGITREPTKQEVFAHKKLVGRASVSMEDLLEFVEAIQPDARLRSQEGLNVRVGNHRPPAGGPSIVVQLAQILDDINDVDNIDPYTNHCNYETLHPFTDGNGRSGRALWLWKMVKDYGHVPPLGFLHTWYYQSLDRVR